MRAGMLLVLLILAAAAGAATQTPPIKPGVTMSPTAAEAPAPPERRLVVAFDRPTSASTFDAALATAKRTLAARSGARGRAGAAISIARSGKLAPRLLRGTTYIAEANSARSAKELLEHFNSGAVPGVRYAELDGWARPTAWPSECKATNPICDANTQDPYDRYWDVRAVKADKVWANTTGMFGAGSIKGAVIDSGVLWTHDDLAGVSDASNRIQCVDGGVGTCPTLAAPVNGDDDHGTHVSCTIGARHNSIGGTPVGMSQSASLMHCKFIGASGGYYSDGVRCIDQMVARGAKVLSNSWGGPSGFSPMRDAITRACKAGVVFVVAAGNENADATTSWPASYITDANAGWCMLSVAATGKGNGRASFSNYGASVNIAAPGVSIVSCVSGYTFQTPNPGCTTCLASYDGTSMATPHVAGAALAIWNTYPSLTNRQIIEALRTGGTPITTDASLLTNATVLNVEAALARAKQLAAPPCSVNADCTAALYPGRPFCSAQLGCVACLSASSCTQPPAGSEATCRSTTCSNGVCSYLKPTGSACSITGSGLPGVCSAAGVCGQCNAASDCKSPPTTWTPSCAVATCKPDRTCGYSISTSPCTTTTSGPGVCDQGTGVCYQCTVGSDCKSPPTSYNTACYTPTCSTSRTCSYPTTSGNTCFYSSRLQLTCATGTTYAGRCCRAPTTRCTSSSGCSCSTCCRGFCNGSGNRRACA